MTIIRPSLDVVYGICRGLPSFPNLSVWAPKFPPSQKSIYFETSILDVSFYITMTIVFHGKIPSENTTFER